MLFLFPFERLDTGCAGLEQGRDGVELGFRRLRLAVGRIERDFRLALVGDWRLPPRSPRGWRLCSVRRAAAAGSAVRFPAVARAAASLSRAAIASACAASSFFVRCGRSPRAASENSAPASVRPEAPRAGCRAGRARLSAKWRAPLFHPRPRRARRASASVIFRASAERCFRRASVSVAATFELF